MTADQDMPNTVGEEAAFWAAQRALPHGAERPEPKPRRYNWLTWPALIVFTIVSLLMLKHAWAAERARNAAWDVFAFRDGKLLQSDAPNIVPVQSAGPRALRLQGRITHAPPQQDTGAPGPSPAEELGVPIGSRIAI